MKLYCDKDARGFELILRPHQILHIGDLKLFGYVYHDKIAHKAMDAGWLIVMIKSFMW